MHILRRHPNSATHMLAKLISLKNEVCVANMDNELFPRLIQMLALVRWCLVADQAFEISRELTYFANSLRPFLPRTLAGPSCSMHRESSERQAMRVRLFFELVAYFIATRIGEGQGIRSPSACIMSRSYDMSSAQLEYFMRPSHPWPAMQLMTPHLFPP